MRPLEVASRVLRISTSSNSRLRTVASAGRRLGTSDILRALILVRLNQRAFRWNETAAKCPETSISPTFGSKVLL